MHVDQYVNIFQENDKERYLRYNKQIPLDASPARGRSISTLVPHPTENHPADRKKKGGVLRISAC